MESLSGAAPGVSCCVPGPRTRDPSIRLTNGPAWGQMGCHFISSTSLGNRVTGVLIVRGRKQWAYEVKSTQRRRQQRQIWATGRTRPAPTQAGFCVAWVSPTCQGPTFCQRGGERDSGRVGHWGAITLPGHRDARVLTADSVLPRGAALRSGFLQPAALTPRISRLLRTELILCPRSGLITASRNT